MAQFDPALFDDPRALVRRARRHIEEASAEIKVFFDLQPYSRIIDHDPDTGQDVHKIGLTTKIPDLEPIVKDAAGNLRDALDHAAYASAVCFVGGAPNNTGFPFANDAAGVAGELGGPRLRGNPPEIRPCLASFNPYHAGNSGNLILCALNRVRNPNTHRMLVPVGTAAIVGTYHFDGIRKGGVSIRGSKWDGTKNQIEYLRTKPGTEGKYEVDASFFIAFQDIEGLLGKEVISALYIMAGEVERVVLTIEAETRRLIGLIS